jgi:gliding motility-associated-like protein
MSITSDMLGKRIVLCLMFVLTFTIVNSQTTLLMPTTGSKDTTISSCVLYDDGGLVGNHSAHTYATYTFRTGNPNTRYRITINPYLYHYNEGLASIKIYNGDQVISDSLLSDNNVHGGQIIGDVAWFTYSSSDVITVEFKADDNDPQPGFMIELDECGCEKANNVVATFTDTTTVTITWDASSTTTEWEVDYTTYFPYNFADESHHPSFANNDTLHTLTTNTNSITINNLDAHSFYSFNVRPKCDTYPGKGIGELVSACPCVKPLNLTMSYDDDSIYFNWENPRSYDMIWTVRDPYNKFGDNSIHSHVSTTHWSMPFICDSLPDMISVVGNCDDQGHLFSKSLCCNDDWVGVEEHLCPGRNFGLNINGATDTSITIIWENVDSVAYYDVYYRKEGLPKDSNIFFNSVTVPNGQYIGIDTITGLEELTRYTITLVSHCISGGSSCGKTITTNTTLNNCIDYVNILSNNTKLYWGTYTEPNKDSTFNNYPHSQNYSSQDDWLNYNFLYFMGTDRHTPILDSSLYDDLTNSQLRCVPTGEKASIKLGNSNIGAESEAISFNYFVDTTDKDMLVLKYAVVLQDPNHTKLNQPRFTLEILDSTGNVIDTTCCFADFYAAGDLGWNKVQGTETIWKDWTTVGIDIAPYHGQNIKIKLTTYDCAEGGHFGYAYFTINCDNKRIYLINRCDAQDSIYLQAPLGFEYKWTKQGDPTILSTTYECLVPADTNNYECLASFIGKPECNFTISSVSINVEPKAKLLYTIDTCNSEAAFYSESYLSYDTTYNIYTKQIVDSIYWVCEDGNIYFDDTLRRKFTKNGDYKVTLFCKLSNSSCIDSATVNIDVDFVSNLTIVGDSIVCKGDSVMLKVEGVENKPATYLWNTGDTTSYIYIYIPNTDTITTIDTTYSCEVFIQNGGCTANLTKQISIENSYSDTIIVDICEGESYDEFNFHENTTGTYTQYLTTINGCDSNTTLLLTVHPTTIDTFDIIGCDEGYTDDNFSIQESGTYTKMLSSIYGCDSLVTINFLYIETIKDTIDAEIYMGDTFTNSMFHEGASGTYTYDSIDEYGCTNTYTLNLKVIELKFPNVITANNDGVNDLFEPKDLLTQTIFDETILRIYNRYGRLIFEKKNTHSKEDLWDPLETNTPTGTYFYRFIAKSKKKNIDVTGTVEVLRE